MSMIDRKKNLHIAFLKEYKGPCPICGYQLNNSTSNRCPECGSQLQVQLRAPYRFSPWLAVLTSTAISVGILFDRVFLTIYGLYRSNMTDVAWKMFFSSLIPFVFLLVIFYAVWKFRTKFEQISLWKRVAWYVAAIVLPIVFSCGQLVLLLYWPLWA